MWRQYIWVTCNWWGEFPFLNLNDTIHTYSHINTYVRSFIQMYVFIYMHYIHNWLVKRLLLGSYSLVLIFHAGSGVALCGLYQWSYNSCIDICTMNSYFYSYACILQFCTDRVTCFWIPTRFKSVDLLVIHWI